ncbi:apolipoprotein N-acyltransferase [Nocardioides sambongensis]|uniref:apolipoprotein N-acyltransferase n=1 Tax=Nocardioides sambongensis TaxID=2589074 RepID=UPI001129F0F5|nr:apolipoprotein N-acyltransferase [Nocardioides sambongensis]
MTPTAPAPHGWSARPRTLVSLVVAVVGGLALAAAFEPIAWAFLLPLGVACFAVATDGHRVRRAGLVGWVFGIAFYFTHISWMRDSIGTDAWIALSTIESLGYGAVGLAMPLLRRLPAWPVWAAAVWTTMEGIRSTWPFSGMPWGRLSFAAIDTPVAPAVTYVGMTGLSFLLALAGFLLAALLHPGRIPGPASSPGLRAGRRLPLVVALAATSAVLLLPALRAFPVQESGTATVAAIQGNLPGPANNILYDARGVTTNHLQATQQLADDVAAGREQQPDFVLWPENSTAVDPFDDSIVNAEIEDAVSAVGVPIVVGGIVGEGEDHVLNQGIVWDPQTGAGDRYTKQNPVPYGEYIPFRDLWDPQFGQLSLITRDMKSGTRTEPLDVAGIRVADAICFDIAYDDVITEQVDAGAEMLAVQTSNASFIFTDQIEQQFAITRLRALEAGRWLVVASPNGRSGVIAPDGSVVATAPPRTQAVLNEQVGLSTTLTPAMRLGPWPGRLFTLLSLGGLLLGSVAYRRRREDALPPHAPAASAEHDAPTPIPSP